MSREFTVYQATNPATDPQTLARMATDRPDLRQFVAANPATPAAVVEWLGTLGDHAVDAALARRRPAAPAQPSSVAPPSGPASMAPGSAPVSLAPPSGPPSTAPAAAPAPGAGQPWAPTGPAGRPWSPAGQPWGPGGPAGQQWAPHGPGAQPWTSSGPTPAPYPPAPGAAGSNPYAAPAAPYGGPSVPGPGGGTPMDAYGYQLPEPRGRRTGLVVAIVVAAVLLVGALVFTFSSLSGLLSDDSTYGEDPSLDRLWDACEAGDGQACDDLYLESPLGSDYEEFGDTCGNRFPAQQVWCAEVM